MGVCSGVLHFFSILCVFCLVFPVRISDNTLMVSKLNNSNVISNKQTNTITERPPPAISLLTRSSQRQRRVFLFRKDKNHGNEKREKIFELC